jgi:site-specific recombinase XerD
MGLAQNTVDAYGRGLEEFLCFARSVGAAFLEVRREHIAAYVRFLRMKPGQEERTVVVIVPIPGEGEWDSGMNVKNVPG